MVNIKAIRKSVMKTQILFSVAPVLFSTGAFGFITTIVNLSPRTSPLFFYTASNGGLGGTVHSYDTQTGEKVDYGDLGFSNLPIEFDRDGTLFAADPGGVQNPLFRLDPDPASTNPNPSWLTTLGNIRRSGYALGFDPLTDNLLLATSGANPSLVEISPAPFGRSDLGSISGTFFLSGLTVLWQDTDIFGYGFAPAGTIIGLQSTSSGRLVAIDRDTLSATVFGDTVGSSGLAATRDGRLFVGANGAVYEHDLATGTETLMFEDSSAGRISSLAVIGAIPEPSFCLLLGMGGIAFAARRCRRC